MTGWFNSIKTVAPRDEDVVLLMFDEFFALRRAFAQRKFEEFRVLDLFREMIGFHPKLGIVLSAPLQIEEMLGWSEHIGMLRPTYIGYLQPKEAEDLIKRPVGRNFNLRYEPAALERVLILAGYHPAVLQALCSSVIDLKNIELEATSGL